MFSHCVFLMRGEQREVLWSPQLHIPRLQNWSITFFFYALLTAFKLGNTSLLLNGEADSSPRRFMLHTVGNKGMKAIQFFSINFKKKKKGSLTGAKWIVSVVIVCADEFKR